MVDMARANMAGAFSDVFGHYCAPDMARADMAGIDMARTNMAGTDMAGADMIIGDHWG